MESVFGLVNLVEGVMGEKELPGLERVVAQEVGLDRVLRALHEVEVAHRDRVNVSGEASGGAELGSLVSEVIVACGKVEVEDLERKGGGCGGEGVELDGANPTLYQFGVF